MLVLFTQHFQRLPEFRLFPETGIGRLWSDFLPWRCTELLQLPRKSLCIDITQATQAAQTMRFHSKGK